MLENLITTAVGALADAGISAGPAYPAVPAVRDQPFVRVGVAAVVARQAGLGRYLGIEYDPESGPREICGLRCDIDLSVDVYCAPECAENGALECARTFDRAAAVLGNLPGLHPGELRCGACAPDPATGLFRLGGTLKCSGLLTAPAEEGQELSFTDFVLRGVLKA